MGKQGKKGRRAATSGASPAASGALASTPAAQGAPADWQVDTAATWDVNAQYVGLEDKLLQMLHCIEDERV